MKRYIIIGGIALALAAAVVIYAASLPKTVTISFVGDVMLSRGVADAMSKYGGAYPFEKVKSIFSGDDLTVANLECPLTNATEPVMKDQSIIFRADPSNAALLKQAGFDLFTLANNHTMDYMSAGLTDTMNALKDNGIAYIGAAENSNAPAPPYIFSKNGVKVGFLAYNCLPPEGFYRDESEPTVMYARPGYLDDMREQVASLSKLCDFAVVYFHWGNEYSKVVSDEQRECAKIAADAGAKLVIGSHPHVLQPSKTYDVALIYYSLGNFVFDKQIPEGTDKSVILQVTVSKNGIVGTKEIPVEINKSQPNLVN